MVSQGSNQSGEAGKGLLNIMKQNFAKFGALDQSKFNSTKWDKIASDIERKDSEK